MEKNNESTSSFQLEKNFNEDLVFLNPSSDLEIKERNLPHWQQGNTVYFVTFHLSDSIPKDKAESLRQEREFWKLNHKEPYSEQDLKEFYHLFSERIENLLNNGHGSCCLADMANAQIVAAALLNFNHERYILYELVVMPNHVHVLIKPLCGNQLSDILHSWKSYTANAINKRVGKSGQFWMRESYDHIIRNEKSFLKIKEYIRNNPIKAGIKQSTSSFQLEKK